MSSINILVKVLTFGREFTIRKFSSMWLVVSLLIISCPDVFAQNVDPPISAKQVIVQVSPSQMRDLQNQYGSSMIVAKADRGGDSFSPSFNVSNGGDRGGERGSAVLCSWFLP